MTDAVISNDATVNGIPPGLARELGLESIGATAVQLGDGRIERRSIYGPITLVIQGRTTATDAVAIDQGTEPVISLLTFRRLDLLIDPEDQKPKPAHPGFPEGIARMC
ncbi:MAG: hypothetical protein HY270_18910 [Deltaproteobacteria bacterium]|nr:hypothetical protein [Deltaproteobacteria bacterium]